jgi:hypothetical protein
MGLGEAAGRGASRADPGGARLRGGASMNTWRGATRGRRPPEEAITTHGASAATYIALALALAGGLACSPSPYAAAAPVSQRNHPFFPLTASHPPHCAGCHTDPSTFETFSCTGCHAGKAAFDLLHAPVPGYAYASAACFRCHPSPAPGSYRHTGITGRCGTCHDAGQPFAVIPVTAFTHRPMDGGDCGACHRTSAWRAVAAPAGLVRDPARDVTVIGLVPSYAGPVVLGATPAAQPLPMSMDHASPALAPETQAACGACHATAAVPAASLYPGELHPALARLGLPQPATCAGCHAASAPVGFVGPAPTAPPRSPPTGEMKHDAVEWSGGAPAARAAVAADCGVCHASPSGALAATWATGRTGAGRVTFHASLTNAALPQPASCLDCHASSRPGAVLAPGAAALPAGVTFDHAAPGGLGDCAACHGAAAAAGGWAAWSGGRWHLSGAATPASCLPCHEGERPTSAAGWRSPTWAAAPFDYGTNAAGTTHGAGQDCALCHAGPGTGRWGGTQDWIGGWFDHSPTGPAATTCISCHLSQRPDLQPGATAAGMAALLGFDHAASGTGDCFGCHQATVVAGSYVRYGDPVTGALPGGDWAGGASYPGATPVSSLGSAFTVTALTLTRSGALVTGFTSRVATLSGAMNHVSPAIPAAISPGPASSPDPASCWRCHTNVGGAVTSYANGAFHPALASYATTPGGPVTPLPEPTTGCAGCHTSSEPAGIVELAGSAVRPMDHAAQFVAPVVIGGVTVTGAAGLDCSACHARSGVTWADGLFHARIGAATPRDCAVCHYPLMATSAADVASGARYVMAHRSPVVTDQRCDGCHAGALARSATTPASAALWQPGTLHASVAAQPATCLDCHAVTAPAASTQSTVAYVFAAGGGSPTNGPQWMSHAAPGVAGADCAACHAADASPSGAAWSRSTAYHAHAPRPAACARCHGLANGNGPVAGAGNNLPAGLTDSSTQTTASDDPGTGVPPGTPDRIDHGDLSVAAKDCGFCHTQVGPSTAVGVQGREWAQARFHGSFSAAAPLVMNGTTARCSHCHLNVKPRAAFTRHDHSTYADQAGTEDCSVCHGWPGTGTPSSPNWLGGGAAPQFITVGGFTIPDPPASPPAVQAGVPDLPHPATATLGCVTCHVGGAGGKRARGYDHASPLAASSCAACHEAGSDLVGTAWNGATAPAAGAGDTRPISLASATPSYKGNARVVTFPSHFYLDRTGAQVDCAWCHVAPAGVALATSGPAYLAAWAFLHPPELDPPVDVCYQCHLTGRPPRDAPGPGP